MEIKKNELLASHTSIKIGGPAKFFCAPKNLTELKEALAFAGKKIIIGRGTNILFSDEEYDGLVIKIDECCQELQINSETIVVGAGISLNKLVDTLAAKNLGGLEFLAGIPGTVGGAVVMNAGAWGSEIGSFVNWVKVVDYQGQEKILKQAELNFAYRSSKISGIVALAQLKVKSGADLKLIAEYRAKRKEKHPLDLPNCGSVFKNPKPLIAAKLIEEAGCKGFRIGDAQISEKHANFIVNLGHATAKDVLELIRLIRERVKVNLELEVKVVLE